VCSFDWEGLKITAFAYSSFEVLKYMKREKGVAQRMLCSYRFGPLGREFVPTFLESQIFLNHYAIAC
jgi:hypothetical protein